MADSYSVRLQGTKLQHKNYWLSETSSIFLFFLSNIQSVTDRSTGAWIYKWQSSAHMYLCILTQIMQSVTNASTPGGSKDSVTLQGAIYHKQNISNKSFRLKICHTLEFNSNFRWYIVSETDICKLIIMSNLPLQINIKSPHWRSIQLTGTYQIWDSYSGVYEVLSPLGDNNVLIGILLPMF